MNIAVAVLLFGYLIGCKDSGTNPTPVIKTPRQMTWTADTLPVPSGAIQFLPEDLLVVSPTDIWLAVWVGHGQIMHYDGKMWKIVKEIGGGINSLLQGNSNDIWAGGYFGHQNGSQFTQNAYLGNYNGVSWYDKELSVQSEILDMTKDPDGNIWACGRNGLVLKYTQGKWMVDTVRIENYLFTDYNLYSIGYYNGSIYISAWIKGNKYANIKGKIKDWKVLEEMIIDSPTSEIKWGNFGLYSLQYNKLYSYGLEGIWEYSNSGWKKSFSFDGEMYNMYGASENYIIGVSAFRRIYFYDGSSWQSISDLYNVGDPTFVFKNVWTDGYDTFITGYGIFNGIEKTVIWHGK